MLNLTAIYLPIVLFCSFACDWVEIYEVFSLLVSDLERSNGELSRDGYDVADQRVAKLDRLLWLVETCCN
jgi:hypothetical protein